MTDIERNDGMPITEEMLVEFIMEHGVTCAEDLDDLSHLIHLIRAEADTPCGAGWIDNTYYLHWEYITGISAIAIEDNTPHIESRLLEGNTP